MKFAFLTRYSAKIASLTRQAQLAARFIGIAGIAASLTACSGINDTWEVKGGGFLRYSINGQNEITQELGRDDVEIPYVRNQHHYLLIKIPMGSSERHDQLQIMVNEPKLGENNVVKDYTWIQVEGTPRARLTGDSNYVSIDQKDKAKWTATVNLHFEDCRQGQCYTDISPILLKGRMHYWIAEDDQ